MRYRRTNHRGNKPDREQLADRILTTALHASAIDSSPASDPAATRMKVEARAARSTRKEYSPMSRIAHHLRTHPGLSVPLVGVVAFLLFAVLVPLPYSATVGYTVSLNGIESGTAVSPFRIFAALVVWST